MIQETIRFPFQGKDNAVLTTYCSTGYSGGVLRKRPTVLIAPGGAYMSCSPREAECVAIHFVSMGMNAAVLTYSVGSDAVFPQSLCEFALALAYLRENHEKYAIDPDRIYTCGFSAGAHLALSLGVFWDKAWLSEKIGKDNELIRPNAQIICYPVVSNSRDIRHTRSSMVLLGENPDPETEKLLSLENQVSENTPPTFLWATQPDSLSIHSMILAKALFDHQIPMEFHMYGWGGHGLSLASRITQNAPNYGSDLKKNMDNPHIATWLPLCKEWLDTLFGWKVEESQPK